MFSLLNSAILSPWFLNSSPRLLDLESEELDSHPALLFTTSETYGKSPHFSGASVKLSNQSTGLDDLQGPSVFNYNFSRRSPWLLHFLSRAPLRRWLCHTLRQCLKVLSLLLLLLLFLFVCFCFLTEKLDYIKYAHHMKHGRVSWLRNNFSLP